MRRRAARPTTYRGIRMRSRLEARYAAHLDRLNVTWTYEPQCFASRVGQYLPDFLIDHEEAFDDGSDVLRVRCYIEVKPVSLSDSATRDLQRRMEIILESEPDAELEIVFVDSDEAWHRPVDGEWCHTGPAGGFGVPPRWKAS